MVVAGLTAYGLPVPAAYLGRTDSRKSSKIRPRSSCPAGDSRAPTFYLEPEDIQLLGKRHHILRQAATKIRLPLRDIYDFHTGP